jgi:hypothetical protein
MTILTDMQIRRRRRRRLEEIEPEVYDFHHSTDESLRHLEEGGFSSGGMLGELHLALASPLLIGSIALIVTGFATSLTHRFLKYNAAVMYVLKKIH